MKNNSIIKRNEPMLIWFISTIITIITIILLYDGCTGGDEIFDSPAITEEPHIVYIHRNIL